MTIFFQEKFSDNNDSRWSNVALTGGPIEVTDEIKTIQGIGFFVGELGFHGQVIAPGISLANKIVQCNFVLENAATQIISVCNISHTPGLGSDSVTPGVGINANSFPTPRIQLFDVGSSTSTDPIPLFEITAHRRYTKKFYFNQNGTVSAWITRFPDIVNHLLGTTSIGVDFLTGPIFFSAQQTFITDGSKKTFWDDIFVHDEGLSFVPPLG